MAEAWQHQRQFSRFHLSIVITRACQSHVFLFLFGSVQGVHKNLQCTNCTTPPSGFEGINEHKKKNGWHFSLAASETTLFCVRKFERAKLIELRRWCEGIQCRKHVYRNDRYAGDRQVHNRNEYFRRYQWRRLGYHSRSRRNEMFDFKIGNCSLWRKYCTRHSLNAVLHILNTHNSQPISLSFIARVKPTKIHSPQQQQQQRRPQWNQRTENLLLWISLATCVRSAPPFILIYCGCCAMASRFCRNRSSEAILHYYRSKKNTTNRSIHSTLFCLRRCVSSPLSLSTFMFIFELAILLLLLSIQRF